MVKSSSKRSRNQVAIHQYITRNKNASPASVLLHYIELNSLQEAGFHEFSAQSMVCRCSFCLIWTVASELDRF